MKNRFLTVLALAVLFCSNTLVANQTRNVHPSCYKMLESSSDLYQFSADIDGKDGKEIFIADRSDGTTVIHACDSDTIGPWDMGDANKPLMIRVVDIEGDGIDEFIMGGNTATSPFTGNVSNLKGNTFVGKESVSFHLYTEYKEGETVGCIGEEGRAEIVHYTFKENDDGSLITWLSDDGIKGQFKLPEEATRAWLFKSGLCRDQLMMNYEVPLFPEGLTGYIRPESPVSFGINNEILLQRTQAELDDLSNWVIPVEHYAGYEGPFALPAFFQKTQQLQMGEHNHCIAAPLTPPSFDEADLVQVSLQPDSPQSCLSWFAVDLWFRADLTLAAVMLNIWEP